MTKKKSPIEAAKALLEKNGYTVKGKRPDPKIGDIVRMEGHDVLITFHDTDDDDAQYVFGGVYANAGNGGHLYTESMWIDRDEWAKDDGQYEVIGHVDLSRFTKVHGS